MKYTKEDYEHMAHRRAVAFGKIAKELGKEHQITKMMGTLAWGRYTWGRYNGEPGVDGGLREYVEAKGYLDGSFSILNQWARDNDKAAQVRMLSIYPRGYSKV